MQQLGSAIDTVMECICAEPAHEPTQGSVSDSGCGSVAALVGETLLCPNTKPVIAQRALRHVLGSCMCCLLHSRRTQASCHFATTRAMQAHAS